MKNKVTFTFIFRIFISILVVFFISHFSSFISAIEAAAQTPNCEPVFGGGASCEQNEPITINKQIQNPADSDYVDSLPPDAKAFTPGQTVRFKLTVANTGSREVSGIAVSDSFPMYVEYAKGSGKYDAKTRAFSFTIDKLAAKSNKVYFIEAKVAAQEKLPNNPQISCVINQARVEANSKISEDNVRLCVAKATIAGTKTTTQATTSKGGLPIYPPTNSKSTPETGPQALALMGLLPLGALGFYLRSKAKT